MQMNILSVPLMSFLSFLSPFSVRDIGPSHEIMVLNIKLNKGQDNYI